MRILYLSNSAIPSRSANSLHVMKMCQAFAANGHRVVLYVPHHEAQEPGAPDPFAFYGVTRSFRLRRIPRERRWMSGALRHHRIIAHLIRLRRPDLLYARDHSLRFELHGIGLPVVLDAHKPIRKARDKRRLTALLGSGNLRRLVVNCEALSRFYQEQFSISGDWIRVAHNGADETAGAANVALGEEGRLQVGYIGQLYAGRGVELIAEMARACPWADFHLVGGMEADVRHWKETLPAWPNLRFHGYFPPPQADAYRRAFDVLLAPYQSSLSYDQGGAGDARWMSPIKIFEYMAAGKAIFASDLSVIREVLEHGVTARLCAPDHVRDWVAGLEAIRDDPDQRLALGRRAQETFRRKHTWKARAAAVLEGAL